jgi:hypothetical protein
LPARRVASVDFSIEIDIAFWSCQLEYDCAKETTRLLNKKGVLNMTRIRPRHTWSACVALAVVVLAAGTLTALPASADEKAVAVPPPKAGETLAQVLFPGKKRVGLAAKSIREMEGGEQAANALFTRLTTGAKDVTPKDFPGKVFERADGATIAYLIPVAGGIPPTIVIQAHGIPIRQLQFPPNPGKDGGGM